MDDLETQREVRSVFDPVARRLGLQGPALNAPTYTGFSLGVLGRWRGHQGRGRPEPLLSFAAAVAVEGQHYPGGL